MACNVELAELIISFIGFIVTLNLLISLATWIFHTSFRSQKDLARAYGSWALVTGATDGIGKAFAHQLARRGLNLILVSRTIQKLQTVACEIKAENPERRVKVVEMDFGGDDVREGLRRVEEACEGLEVGVVINNVGMTYPRAMWFHEVEEKVWRKIVRVNMEGTTSVTKVVLKGMLERRRGAIVNIGSAAAVVVPSHPLFTIYAATKAYVDQLSRSLYVEYGQYGIHVQCQVPLYVATNMASGVASIERASLFVPTAEAYARAAIREIGLKPRCTPYWAHSIQWCLANFIPDPLLDAWRLSIGMRRRNQKEH
ncbi:very-long-chain 3-oxoacyl-CoA reductase-like protein At1g24470 [Cajanus cajan]|nr:very-long-chain 3-oxoacyl-CoA reductase-like protein At1g24470 [Cajanus cajan]